MAVNSSFTIDNLLSPTKPHTYNPSMPNVLGSSALNSMFSPSMRGREMGGLPSVFHASEALYNQTMLPSSHLLNPTGLPMSRLLPPRDPLMSVHHPSAQHLLMNSWIGADPAAMMQNQLWGSLLHKLQLHKRKGGQVRFTNEQTVSLERKFNSQKYLSPSDRKKVAKKLQLSERQVKTWFQNRRAKWRRLRQDQRAAGNHSQKHKTQAANLENTTQISTHTNQINSSTSPTIQTVGLAPDKKDNNKETLDFAEHTLANDNGDVELSDNGSLVSDDSIDEELDIVD